MLATLLVLVGLYLVVGAAVWVFQDRLLFMPVRELQTDPKAAGLDYEDVELRLDDGTRVHGWFVRHPRPRATVVFCHGNAGNVSHRLPALRLLNELGLETLIFDYPGYGRSGGKPGEASSYAAAAAAYDEARSRAGQDGKIVVWGRSLGGAVATWLCARREAAALVVESSMHSIAGLAKSMYWWLPAVARLCRHRYDSAVSAARVPCPKIFFHSPDDGVVPLASGQLLYDAAAPPKRFVETSGGHNDHIERNGQAHRGAIEQFLDEAVGRIRATPLVPQDAMR